MAWVRSEYAGELAVVAAWVSALLPWSVSFLSPEGFSFVVVRFPFFLFQFLYGFEIPGDGPFQTIPRTLELASNQTNRLAYTVWLIAALVLLLALVLSLAYYAREDRVESAPVDPVRVMGGLLLVVGLLLLASVALLWVGSGGVTVPIGAILVTVLGVVLLRVERTGDAVGAGDRGDLGDRRRE